MLSSHVLLALSGLLVLCWAGPCLGTTLDAEQDATQSMEQARRELQTGQLDRAELLLERVLMLQPENAEARVELAFLMARRGQVDTARALLQGLMNDPRTPAEHRGRLKALHDGLANASSPLSGAESSLKAKTEHASMSRLTALPRWRVESSLSWSSNPLARTSLSDISITTPDGPMQVPLTTRARQGVLVGLGLARLERSGGLEVQVQEVAASGATTAARVLAWGVLPTAWIPAVLDNESYGLKQGRLVDALQWNLQIHKGLDGARRALGGLTAVSGGWRWSLQRYEEPDLSDRGNLLRVEALLSGNEQLQWGMHAERTSSSARNQGTLRLGWQAQWVPATGWRASLLWQAQNDTQRYSPLLADGAPRKLRTVQASVEKAVNLGSEKTLTVRLLTTHRRSNIELFGFSETAFQLNLTGLWR